MKIRNGFVTNSSSSSFILSFKDEDDYQDFKEMCEYNYYEELFELIDNCRQRTNFDAIENEETDEYDYVIPKDINEVKKNVIEDLKRYFLVDFEYEFVKQRIKSSDFENYKDYMKAEEDFKKTEEYINAMNEFLSKTKYEQYKKDIENDEIIVTGMIWDSQGGLLEWAIRQGLLQDVCRRWVKYVLNVG